MGYSILRKVSVVLLTVSAGLFCWEVPSAINYQGYLTKNGLPFNGITNISLQLRNNGTPVWNTNLNCNVQDGVYYLSLAAPQSYLHPSSNCSFTVSVAGTAVTPDVVLNSVPYAYYASRISWSNISEMPSAFADGFDNTSSDWNPFGGGIFYTNGYVAIGAATGAYPLDVNGTVRASTFLGSGSGLSNIPGQWSVNGTNFYYNSGNVGIGTSAPAQKLTVSGSIAAAGNITANAVVIGAAASGFGPAIQIGNDVTLYDINAANVVAVLGNYNSNVAGIKLGFYGGTIYGSNNNIGIGTEMPLDRLQIDGGNIRIGTADRGIVFSGGGERIIGTAAFGIDFQTSSGTSRMTILNGGNVGIGTTNAVAKLHVNGSLALGNGAAATKGTGRAIELTTSSVFGSTYDDHTGVRMFAYDMTGWQAAKLGIQIGDNWGSYYGGETPVKSNMAMVVGLSETYIRGNLNVGNAGASAARLWVHESAALGSAAGNRLTLARFSGNAGNTVVNSKWLYRDAAGSDWMTARVHDAVSVDGSFFTPGIDTKTWWERDAYNDIQAWGTAGSTYMSINAGLVGIGVTPIYRLDVGGDIRASGALYSSAGIIWDAGGGWVRTYGNTGWISQTWGGGWYMTDGTWLRTYGNKNIYQNAGILRTDGEFHVGDAGARFVVNAAGNVGINITNPSYDMHVNGTLWADTGYFTTVRPDTAIFSYSLGLTVYQWQMDNVNNDITFGSRSYNIPGIIPAFTPRYEMTTAAFFPSIDVGPTLGTAANRWDTVYAVQGLINTSDERLKKDIHPIAYGLNDLLKLNPVDFKWKNGKGGVNLGLIAQETLKVIPEAVEQSSNTNIYMGINYSMLLPVVIQSIKDQQKNIEALTAEVKMLKQKLAEK